jgi:glucokinase
MMNIFEDDHIVMTLDAGGTNFVFSAMQAGKEIVTPVRLPSQAHDLKLCLTGIIDGFTHIKKQLPMSPAAISFAFPGVADYPNGIIGDLQNLPAFRGGVALGPMLEDIFHLPVFINNDGDLYAYGEAIGGYLPYVNHLLKKSGSMRRYKNLIGVTLGTGFGGGIVIDGRLLIGDNSGAAEVGSLSHKFHAHMNVEESVSIRGIRRVFAREAAIAFQDAPSPRIIFEIGTGKREGNQKAAVVAYRQMAVALGDALANIMTLVDGIAVIGGGIAEAHPLFLNTTIEEINSMYHNPAGDTYRRLSPVVFNLEDEHQCETFIEGDPRLICVPESTRQVNYDPLRRLCIGISKIGTSQAIALGACHFALSKMVS